MSGDTLFHLRILISSGADPTIVNKDGVTPMSATYFDRDITEMIAGMLQMEIDFSAVQQGREACDGSTPSSPPLRPPPPRPVPPSYHPLRPRVTQPYFE